MRLPIEVSEAVIDQAGDNVPSLCNLSLTCSAFLPRSRVHLFSGIHIGTVERMESSRHFFDAHPWLLPLIREVTLSFVPPEDYSKPNVRVLDVVPVHLLTRLPKLRSWTMRSETQTPDSRISLSLHRSVLSLYWRHSSHIHTLHLSCLRFYCLTDFTGLVSAFTSIQNLTCYCIEFRRKDQLESTPPWYVGAHPGILSRPLQISSLSVSCRSTII